MSDASAPSEGSPFWRFSLRFYRLPKAADACIELQEEAGVDVNLLLFLLWHARQRRRRFPFERESACRARSCIKSAKTDAVRSSQRGVLGFLPSSSRLRSRSRNFLNMRSR